MAWRIMSFIIIPLVLVIVDLFCYFGQSDKQHNKQSFKVVGVVVIVVVVNQEIEAFKLCQKFATDCEQWKYVTFF